MKKIRIIITILFISTILLMACSNDVNQNGNDNKTNAIDNDNNEKNNHTIENSQINGQDNNPEATIESENTTADNLENNASKETSNETLNSSAQSGEDNQLNNKSQKEKIDKLSHYSAAEIEYARVWLQLGPNPEIDELNVRHISAGEPVNLYDETSANYPEDVIVLEGSRSVDGSITYSGNGDGTINVYDVPSHWSSPAQVEENFMKEYTEEIINNTKLVPIDPGDDEKVIYFIEMIHIHN